MTTFVGLLPTPTVATTVLVAVDITDTSSEPSFTTYTSAPSGVIAMSVGLLPTAIVATTVFVTVETTDTLLEVKLATYSDAPSGVIPNARGVVPTGTVELLTAEEAALLKRL